MRFKCPHCGAPCAVRTSQMMSKTCAVARLRCSSDFCGFVFKAAGEIIGYYVQSARPSRAVVLPQLAAPARSSVVGRNANHQVLEVMPSKVRECAKVAELKKEQEKEQQR